MFENHEQLKKLVYKGARDKKLDLSDIVLDRISHELSIIEALGFSEYFIIYSRIIEICNELNVLRSFGRGNAANSIVNYCLDITKINPIDENLIFERFIHPHQSKLPDIDIDIPLGYQKNVIQKLKQEYPEYNVYYIAYSPQMDNTFIDIVFNNITYKKHPCGIIITSDKLTASTFLYSEQEFYLVHDTQNDPIYENKFDILELGYLNRIQLIVDEIGEKHHPHNLPFNDKKVFDFFASGDLENIFQFNSPSMKNILAQFQPDSINDLSIINAMFRPGPLNYIQKVIRYKFNEEGYLKYNDSRVSEILKETYGLLIYQETFLHLSKEIAGIPFSKAEVWRKKIMRDKNNTESTPYLALFKNGCRENSCLSESEISSLTEVIAEMLPFCFPKAHAICYSLIGYWGAYYKTYFRSQFDNAFSKDVTFQPFELY